MKILLLIFAAVVVFIATLAVLRAMQKVSADVVSCEIDHGQANIVMHYRNQSSKPVTLSYDLVIMRDTSSRRSSSGGAQPVKSRHVVGIDLAAAEAKDEIVSITVPEKLLVANAVAENLSYVSEQGARK